MTRFAAILLLLTAQTTAAQAPIARASIARAVTAPWSVAGVSLGMKPGEVEAALKAAGYTLGNRYMRRSWQGEVANKVSSLRGIRVPDGARVIRLEGYKKGQESVEVEYGVTPAGPYVSRVRYSIRASVIDEERFRAAVLSRYGRPSLNWGWESLYCSVQESKCSRTGSLIENQFPNLSVRVADVMSRSLELRQGARADLAQEAAIKAEVDRLYPKKDKPSF